MNFHSVIKCEGTEQSEKVCLEDQTCEGKALMDALVGILNFCGNLIVCGHQTFCRIMIA